MCALLVVVSIAFIFVQVEFSLRSAEDAQLNRTSRLLACVLDFRAERNDGPCADKQRNAFQGSFTSVRARPFSLRTWLCTTKSQCFTSRQGSARN